MKNPKFSIIIPVFNCKKYIHRMITSVLAQTYTRFELILIDDGSKDDSSYMCDEYSFKDNRIIVIHQNNCGASSARNKGIAIASGEYQIIWDSDDYVEQNTLEILSDAISEHSPDVVRFNFMVERPNKSTEIRLDQPYNRLLNREYIVNEIIPYMIGIKVCDSKKVECHCTFAVSRKIIDSHVIKYDEQQRKEEDHVFIVKVMAYAGNILFLDNHFYHYIKHENSLIAQYSQRYQNICNNFTIYQNLFKDYYDFTSQTKIKYNIEQMCECLFLVMLYRNSCNACEEVKLILSREETKEWLKLLVPYNTYTKMLKWCVKNKAYFIAYYYVLINYYFRRMGNLVKKIHND